MARKRSPWSTSNPSPRAEAPFNPAANLGSGSGSIGSSRDPAHAHLHNHPEAPPPGWVAVQSSNLVRVRYVGAGYADWLEITFGGEGKVERTYRYFDVPWNIYWGLLSAASKGTYHHQVIKNKFDFIEL